MRIRSQMNRGLVVFVQPSEERIELCVSKGIEPNAPAESLLLKSFEVFFFFCKRDRLSSVVNITVNSRCFPEFKRGLHFLFPGPSKLV